MGEPIIFEDTISYLLAKVTTAFRNSLERHMTEIGLHSGQIFLLIELWNEDGLKQVDLAKRLSVKAPTVSNMLRGLAEINLIRTEAAEDDGRSVRVFLTEKGKKIRFDVEKRWVDVEAECIATLAKNDRLILQDVLKQLRSTYTGQKLEEEED